MRVFNKFLLVFLMLLMFIATAFGDMYAPGGIHVTTVLDPTDDHAVPSSYAVSTYLSGGFSQNVLILTDYKLYFRDTGLYLYSSTNGQLDVVADTVLTLTSPTITVGASTAYGLTSPAVTITATTSIVHKYDAASYLTQTVTNAGDVKLTVTGDTTGSFEIETDDAGITLDAANNITLDAGTGDIDCLDAILMATTSHIQFHDTGLYIGSSADGALAISSDGTLAISATTSSTLTSPVSAIVATTSHTVTSPTMLFVATASATLQGNLVVQNQRLDKTAGYENYITFEGYLDATYADDTEGETRGLLIDYARTVETVTVGNTRDQALKLSISDYVGGHASGYFIRAFDMQTKFDASGETITAIYGGNITSYVKNGTVGESYVLRLGMKGDGVISGEFVGLIIQSESQGTISGDSIGLQFSTSAINPATGAVTYCIEVAPANTSGFDAFIHFTDGDKTDGSYTSLVVDADGQDSDAGIKVVINATDYYIPLYTDAHVSGEW